MTNLYADARAHESPEPLPVPTSALSIGAHPDDAEFGAGATLARWASQGTRVSMLIVTDGSKGSWDPQVGPQELAETRAAEQRRAAEALGTTGEVVNLGYVDGEVEYSMDLRRQVCWWIRRLRPAVVLSHDPWRRYMLHPDHRAVGFAAIDGVVAARDHLFFPDQGMDKHRPEALLLWSADEPDHWEDARPGFDAKIAALLCHRSQTITTMRDAHSDEAARETFVQEMREWSARQGERVALPLAESFKLIRP
jgi:LmbE family N-acetylglucosaminyl deacetylase